MPRSPFRALALVIISGSSSLVAQPAALTAGQMRDDLAWFKTNVFQVEKSYTPASRVEAERRLTQLEQRIGQVTPVAFVVEISRVVALADNGHSNVFAMGRSRVANHVPIRLVTFGDEFRVLRAIRKHADLLGAKLVAIDGHPVAVARDSARTMFGGTPAWRDRNVPLALESPDQMYVLGITRDAGAAEYEFELSNGRRAKRRLEGAAADFMPPPDQLLYPATNTATDGDWVAVKPAATPWSLDDPLTTFRWRPAPEIDGVVIQLRRIVDGPGQQIAPFLVAMSDRIREAHPRNLVVDLRLNSGGNLNNTRDFMKSLPSLVTGRVFVITAPSTFSAAISSVGYLKQAAPERVAIVGEEAGDRLVFFAEGRPASAPNSGMMIGVATQRHDYQNGCKAFTDCHGPVVRFPIAIPSLRTEIPAPLTFAEWKAGVDPAMVAIARAVKTRHS